MAQVERPVHRQQQGFCAARFRLYSLGESGPPQRTLKIILCQLDRLVGAYQHTRCVRAIKPYLDQTCNPQSNLRRSPHRFEVQALLNWAGGVQLAAAKGVYALHAAIQLKALTMHYHISLSVELMAYQLARVVA